MANAPIQLGQDPQYDRFLSTPVGEDRHGINVTVLSMLSRLGVDPWGEASSLAKLPDSAARKRLESLIARFHDVAIPVPDRREIVAGLLASLPRQGKAARTPSDGAPASRTFPTPGPAVYWIVATIVFVGWFATLVNSN